MMTLTHRDAALLHFIRAALPAVEALPTSERMDALEGLAEACGHRLPEMSQAARAAAQAIREANQSQLVLRELLK
jgi:hypothetical protein